MVAAVALHLRKGCCLFSVGIAAAPRSCRKWCVRSRAPPGWPAALRYLAVGPPALRRDWISGSPRRRLRTIASSRSAVAAHFKARPFRGKYSVAIRGLKGAELLFISRHPAANTFFSPGLSAAEVVGLGGAVHHALARCDRAKPAPRWCESGGTRRCRGGGFQAAEIVEGGAHALLSGALGSDLHGVALGARRRVRGLTAPPCSG
jgi:hypothetical protein